MTDALLRRLKQYSYLAYLLCVPYIDMQISSVQIKASPVTMQLLFESDEAIGIESLPAATI